jgi:hypothetical protein
MKPQLVIFSTDAELIDRLCAESTRLPFLSFAVGDGLAVTKAERLDALKVSQMDAVERYRFNPPHPLLEARVLTTPPDLIQRGLPRYAISGVALPRDYQRNVKTELELDVSAMLKAIQGFNQRGEDQILRVGMLPDSLSLDKVAPAEAFQIVERIYSQLVSPSAA